MSRPTRALALAGATVFAAGALAAPATTATAATTGHTACQSKRSFFDVIPAKGRRHLWHHKDPSRAVRDLRCTSHWSVALVTATDSHGRPEYSFEVLEHRTGSGWHLADRAKACEAKQIPKKLHHYVCESD